ncbi:LysR family transcriptional regulator [Cobetia sp. 14N.309.X.WAT.E.A4]|uniref:LysR family transcriptional regulator n=1 Tax=Cobetia sp. 14N.309.X.WAT.E.A4 TaxID=2998323 RepID=UPI0025B02BF5|nr:LysR family transcriptional regulator [Cobetia sp. 14N.309.X.WAT.E.A4]MDN2656495.1 LysR family transcriptional regulator [Cobetia sp. 14N.309.X.WAT.E.A4]
MQDLSRLHAFVTVARTGSVSRAAEALHLTQPAVSLKLKQLQESLGLSLFDRHPHGLQLTADGQALLSSAESTLASARQFEQAASALHSTLRGTLRIGTIIDPEFIRLGSFLRHLLAQAPGIETSLQHGMSGCVLKALKQDELEIGFYLAPPGEGPGDSALDYRELALFEYYVLAPAGWSSRLTATDWASLAALPWIVTPPKSVHSRLLAHAMRGVEATLHRVAQVDQEVCMLDLVRAGVGLSLARDVLALAERQERGLNIVPDTRLPCALSVVWRRDKAADPSVQAALQSLANVWPVE